MAPISTSEVDDRHSLLSTGAWDLPQNILTPHRHSGFRRNDGEA